MSAGGQVLLVTVTSSPQRNDTDMSYRAYGRKVLRLHAHSIASGCLVGPTTGRVIMCTERLKRGTDRIDGDDGIVVQMVARVTVTTMAMNITNSC